MKITINMVLMSGMENPFFRFLNPVIEWISRCESFSFIVSLNTKAISNMFTPESIAANQNGVELLNHETRFEFASSPPRKGPIMNPKPNAIPINPKFFILDFLSLMSAIAEFAIARFPDMKPLSILLPRIIQKLFMIIPMAKIT